MDSAIETRKATASASRRIVEIALVSAALVSFAIYRFVAASPNIAPPGSDGGNWLAFGRELFGEDVKAADSTYPPILPGLLWAASKVVGPLAAAKLLGALVSVSAGIPLYLIATSGVEREFALLATIVFVGAGYRSEVLAFGGYPQLLAEAFVLATIWMFSAGAIKNSSRLIVLAALFASLAIGTHHLSSIYLIVSLMVAGLALLLHGIGVRYLIKGLLLLVLLAILFAAPYYSFYYSMITQLSELPFNAQGWALSTAGETFSYIFRNSVGLWYALMGISVAVLLVPLPRKVVLVRVVAIASLVGPMSLFAYFAEVRFLQFLFAGIALGVALFVGWIWELLPDKPLYKRHAPFACFAVASAAIVWGGVLFTRQAYPWYQVVDAPRLEALEWLKEATPRESLIASTPTKNGWAIGWWIEGFSGRRTVVGADARWMSFRQEKVHALLADSIVSSLITRDEASAYSLMSRNGISYLFIDKAVWRNPQLSQAFFARVFENDGVVILERRQAKSVIPNRASSERR